MSGITYTGAQIPTDFKQEVIAEILFRNHTVEKGLVAFETGIKAGRVITENINSVTMQAWTVNPTGSEAGDIGLEDTVVTPVKVEYYRDWETRALQNRKMKYRA